MENAIPRLSAIEHIWDNEQRHMVSCMNDYFKQGVTELQIAICDNKTGKEMICGTVTPEKFYKSPYYLSVSAKV